MFFQITEFSLRLLWLFEVMFPDSKIASQMELGRIKSIYTVNFGITPYFRKILKNEIVNSEWYTISFDESLNKVVQECKMDVIIRFLYNLSNKVQVRFRNSMFFWAQYFYRSFKTLYWCYFRARSFKESSNFDGSP